MMRPSSRGFALLIVILTLAALLAIATPFLLSMRSADRVAVHRVAASRARVAAEGGLEHARRFLEDTHPSRDTSPLADGPAEIDPPLPGGGEGLRDPRGTIVSVRVEDEQAKIHLNSAPPALLGSLLGGLAFLARPVGPDDVEIHVDSTEGFPDEGVLWIRNELVQYRRREGNRFAECTRGFLADSGRFEEPAEHAEGTPVLDDRVHAIVRHRIGESRGGEWSPFPSLAALRRVEEDSTAGAIPGVALDRILPFLTVYSDRLGSGEWTDGVRVHVVRNDRREQPRILAVSNPHLFSRGSVVRIATEGKPVYGIALAVGSGGVVLEAPLSGTIPGEFEATACAQIRHPVNANAAAREVLEACLRGLRLRGVPPDRGVSRAEADAIVNRILAGRPIVGFQDFLERVLDAAVEEGEIGEEESWAIYRNAWNANDAFLDFSTVPFTFATGDVYTLEASASVNARSGVERGRVRRREVLAVRPQEPIFLVLGTQEMFDDRVRLSRAARWWHTGSRNTFMWDSGDSTVPNVPPSGSFAHLGVPTRLSDTAGREGGRALPTTDPAESYVEAMPARRAEIGPFLGRVEHFDADTNPDGRDPSREPYAVAASAPPTLLAAPDTRVFPGSMEAWFRSDGTPGTGAALLDLGGPSLERDRISLLVDGADLVLRAYDDGGEDARTSVLDAGEVRVALADFGFQPNTWYHLCASFEGSRPSDLALEIDGFPRGRRLGFTRLTGSVGANDEVLPVESVEGFPTDGPFAVRIGGEPLLAAGVAGEIAVVRVEGKRLRAQWVGAGNATDSWAGGRGAREGATVGIGSATGWPPPGVGKPHPAGAGVELYGYAATLASPVIPIGGAVLPEDIGPFSVAHVLEVEPPPGAAIVYQSPQFGPFPLGTGIEADGPNRWVLGPVDPGDTTYAAAFQPSGGYALVFQRTRGIQVAGGVVDEDPHTAEGTPLFGVELIRYSGRQGDTLLVSERGLGTDKLTPGSLGDLRFDGMAHAFLVKNTLLPSEDNDPRFWVYVMPISLGANGVSATTYLPPGEAANADSEYVQIYERANEGITEWVAYDEILQNFFVRTNPTALRNAILATWPTDPLPPLNPGAPPGLPGGGPGGGGFSALAVPPTPAQSGSTIPGTIGIPTALTPRVAAADAQLRMRGVHGTYTHPHTGGADLIPVFRTSAFAGRPGRHDRVAVVEPGTSGAPFRFTVNWSAWNLGTGGNFLVAFKEQAGLGYSQVAVGGSPADLDSRNFTRLLKSPSGELPQTVAQFTAGIAFDGTGGAIGGAIDEIATTTAAIPGGAYAAGSTGRFLLAGEIGENDMNLDLAVTEGAYPHGVLPFQGILDEIPEDGGVLRIDEEWMVYSEIDKATGRVRIAPNGRGALGTTKSAHGDRAAVHFLDHRVAGQLATNVTEASDLLGLRDVQDFPFEGTAMVGLGAAAELVHWTRVRNGGLEMPRRSETPGADDAKGDGLFRGRYGTLASTHGASEPVLLWPIRYWDRARPFADAPELSFYEVDLRAEDAFFRGLYWEEEIPFPTVDLVALARVDAAAPWDADPEKTPDLFRFTDPILGGEPVRLGRQGSRLEVRLGVEYLPGAFDPIAGAADGWKSSPRVRTFVVDYLAPNRVLRTEEDPR